MKYQPRLIQTYLPDGTLEGVRIIELSESSIKAFVIPRLKLNDVKNRLELQQPALYFLLSLDRTKAYVGESENFFNRVKNHDQNKEWWDIAVAIVSNTNTLEKSDVKYLESLAVQRSQNGSMQMENKTVPVKNNIHEFKLHVLERILVDSQMILTSINQDVLSVPDKTEQHWYIKTKLTNAKAVYRGSNFIVYAGALIDKTFADSWYKHSPNEYTERLGLFKKVGEDMGETVRLKDNVSFTSPNHAGRILSGRSVNAWTTWKDERGRTMDEVMRSNVD